MKEGPLRRNGVFHSDNAVMTEFIIRHDDMLTLTAIVDDPTVLDEPHIISRTFVNDPTLPAPIVGNPCTIIEAPGLDPGATPHYLPGQNPFIADMVKINLPREVIEGGGQTFMQIPRDCGRTTPDRLLVAATAAAGEEETVAQLGSATPRTSPATRQ